MALARKWHVPLTTAIVFLNYLAIDFISPWVIFDAMGPESFILIEGACIGAGMAQISLIALWNTLVPGNLLQRITWSVLMLVLMWYSLILGCRAVQHYTMGEATSFGVVLLLSTLTAQLPLFMFRVIFGWKIVDAANAGRPREAQFRLQQLMLSMLLLCLTLAAGRAVLPPGNFASPDFLDSGIWLLFVIVPATTVLSFIPAVWIAFRIRWATMWSFIGLWTVYVMFMTGIQLAIIASFDGHMDENTVVGFFVVNVAFNISVLVTLLLYRRLSWQLQWRYSKKQIVPAPTAASE